jgi:hypothetical protein
MTTPTTNISIQSLKNEFAPYGGGNSLSDYYLGTNQFVPPGIPTSGQLSIGTFRGLTRRRRFPNTGGGWSTNYDFYLGGPYGTANPLRLYLARSSIDGTISYQITFYTNYCGNQPTFSGSFNPSITNDSGWDCEYVDLGWNWNKGCCNGNNNNITMYVRIQMTPGGGISCWTTNQWTDGQWSC